jgi:hypothetical protein
MVEQISNGDSINTHPNFGMVTFKNNLELSYSWNWDVCLVTGQKRYVFRS